MEVKRVTDKDIDELEKECPENIIRIVRQDEGYFTIVCDQSHIPLQIANEILKQLHTVYLNHLFDNAYDNLPEEHKKYQIYLEKRIRSQKRWIFFWYAIAIAALGYIFILGGN